MLGFGRGLSRRELLRQFAGTAVCVPALARNPSLLSQTQARKNSSVQPAPETTIELSPLPPATYLSPGDDTFLEQLENAIFQFFWEQCNPKTGIVKDRCNVRGSDTSILGSIAATGFGLTALCIGEKRGYVSYSQARDRALTTLRFLWKKMPQERGFYYHWANIGTGERLWLSEDTRILPHGWTPEGGFLQYRWDSYSEMMMMYLLGLGSSSHVLPPQAWDAWKRTVFEFDGIRYIGSYAPLFVHQYSQAWFDFRGKRDKYADYFQNSILATDAHRRFCLSLSKKFSDYSENLWGITASDSEHGYEVWGGPPATGPIDGTVVPCASAGSLPFLPGPVMRVLRTIQCRYGAGTWSRYGFVDAFNP